MGFPQRAAEGVVSICVCHKEAKIGGGYTCPRCKARVCELPTECRICGLTLVSSPHLARSYHHLFPIAPFDEVSFSSKDPGAQRLPSNCFGCMQNFKNPGMHLETYKNLLSLLTYIDSLILRCSYFGYLVDDEGTGTSFCVTCPNCKKYFCLDCDIYIHESLHNCPGCESLRHSTSMKVGVA